MHLKRILLAGAALFAISAAPAMAAKAPHIHVLAMHKGALVKSAAQHRTATAYSLTYAVSSGVSTAASYKVKTNLGRTYYTWVSNSSYCQEPKKEALTLSTKKTVYAKIGKSTETGNPASCATANKFYGVTYDLVTKKAAGAVDTLSSTLKAKFKEGGITYAGKLTLDISVSIGA